MGQESECGLAERSWVQVFQEVIVMMLTKAAELLEGLAGVEGSTSKIPHSHGRCVGAGCCKRLHSVHCHTKLSTEIPRIFMTW